MGELLVDFGYGIYPDSSREQQFNCDLHGPDNKPSARYYPQSNSTYCFACQKARGPIDYVIEKEGLSFKEACDFLERKANLPSLPWEDDGDETSTPRPNTVSEIETIQQSSSSFEEEFHRVDCLLINTIREKELDLGSCLAFAEALDCIEYSVEKQGWTEQKGKQALQKLRLKMLERLKEVQ